MYRHRKSGCHFALVTDMVSTSRALIIYAKGNRQYIKKYGHKKAQPFIEQFNRLPCEMEITIICNRCKDKDYLWNVQIF